MKNLNQLQIGDKVYWKNDKKSFTVKAKTNNYILCSRNIFGKCNYSVLDLNNQICGIAYTTLDTFNLLKEEDSQNFLDLIEKGINTFIKGKERKIKDVIDLEKTLNK